MGKTLIYWGSASPVNATSNKNLVVSEYPDSGSRGASMPLVCKTIPFICYNKALDVPFVGFNKPAVCFRGFSLIELLITTIIVGVLAAVAIPSLTTFVLDNRLRSQVNDFVTDLNYARTEAITKRTQVAVCAGTVAGCVAASNWNSGRIVFVDTNENDAWDAGETVLRVKEAFEGENTLNATNGGGKIIVFDRNGIATNATGDWTYAFCDRRGTAWGREITVFRTGRVQLSTTLSGGC